MKGLKSTLVALLLLFLFSVTFYQIEVKAQPKTIVVPDNYSSIQEAIDQASQGDTVFVKSGTYNGSVTINKSISLIGENKEKTTIIGDWELNGTTILVQHDTVTISELTLESVGNAVSGRGVHLLHVRYCKVSNCNFATGWIGVWLYGASENKIENNYIDGTGNIPFSSGINLQGSHNNTITGNDIAEYDYGLAIILNKSIGNIVTENPILNCYNGIWVHSSYNNSIIGNNVTINDDIFVRVNENVMQGSCGLRLFSSSNNVIAGNNISDVPNGIRIKSASHFNQVENNTLTNNIYWGLALTDDANNNTLVGNNLLHNINGLEVGFCSNNTIKNNCITANHDYGIYLYNASTNKITANNITDNQVGAYFTNSSNNIVYHNNFLNNPKHVSVITSSGELSALINAFDNGFPSGGNYWDDYTGTDSNNDGIGDTPYIVSKHGDNTDNYPIIETINIETIPEFPSWIILPLFLITTLIGIFYRKHMNKLRIKFLPI